MRVYREEERFCTKTGNSLGKTRVSTHDYVCDFCGRLIEDGDYEHEVGFTYRVSDSRDMEEIWYGSILPDKFVVEDMHGYVSGLGEEFHYCDGEELIENCSVVAANFDNYDTLAASLWGARFKAIEKTEVDYRSLSYD